MGYEEASKIPLYDGVAAIRAIREKLGWRIPIVAYSNFPQAQRAALQAGANGFLPKSTPGDEFREQLRNAHVEGQVQGGIGKIVGLEIYPCAHNNQLIVVGEMGRTPRIGVDPYRFAFLYYLAEERKQGREGFVVLCAGRYDLAQKELWARICAEVGTDRGPTTSYAIGDQILPGLCNDINGPLIKRRIEPIIQTPGPHGSRGPHKLSARILADQILVHR